METIEFNQSKVEALSEKILDSLNLGALALMISVGHRTGLFDIMSGLDFSTSHEVAEAAGLNERYVREWLGTMTVAGIVENDPVTKKYFLPAEHAAILNPRSGRR
jgi:hypothetical protein